MATKKGRSGNPANRAAQSGTSQVALEKAESGKGVALYHDMRADDDFDDTAERIFQIVRESAARFPGKPRHLYLDVEKHRNEAGGFDHDANELMTNFIVGYLMRWLTEVHTPLGSFRNPDQREDLPAGLTIMPGGDAADREETLRKHAEAMGEPIYDSEAHEMVDANGRRSRDRG